MHIMQKHARVSQYTRLSEKIHKKAAKVWGSDIT